MEKEKKQQQRPKEAEGGDNRIWESAFDSKATPTAQPPAAPLTANPAEGERHAEEGEYEPETVVFDIGGFADPNNPAEGNGKGIKVVIPPDLDGPTALVHVVMAMMRLTEAEAKVAIVEEGIQWTAYRPEGHGTDREGNVIHLMRFKPKYSERTAHEPETLRPAEGDDLERYKAFKAYLQDHDGDNIRDPYVQYDRWATEMGFFAIEHMPDGDKWLPSKLAKERIKYEKGREAVVQYVVWERLRAKRESLADRIKDEQTDAKSLVGAMADRFPAMIDMAAMQYYMKPEYFTAWNALHGRMILAQGALEKGDTHAFQNGDLGAKVYRLAYWFAEMAQERLGVWQSDARKVFHQFDAADVQAIGKLTDTKEPTLEQGREMLYLYYKLTFAMMEAAGKLMAHGTEKTMLQPHEDKELNLQGRQIENQGKTGAAMLGMLGSHPNAKRVNATFYPDKETKDFRQGGEKDGGGDDWSQGVSLDLYLWHDADKGEWVLEDFSSIEEHKVNRAKGAADAPVPAALFEELDSKLRFPKGALYYRCPDEASYRIMRTTEPITMGDWLRGVAIAGLAVGLAAMTFGASIPAQVLMIGSAAAMAGAEVADIVAEKEQGMLTTERVVVHSAMIASCVLSGTSAVLGLAGKAGTGIARIVHGLQIAADGVCVAVFTTEAFEGLKAAADDPEGATFTRLLGFFLQMGMNGLMLYGMHSSGKMAAGMEVDAAERELLNEAKRELRSERMAARGKDVKGLKANFDEELGKLFDKGRGKVVETRLVGSLGALGGGVAITISVTNFRKLCGIVRTLMRNGVELSVESVMLRLEKLGNWSAEMLAAHKPTLQLAINDVLRKDMTAAEIEFADSYYLHVAESDITNYELREMHRMGYTVDAATGKLLKPSGRAVDFKHEFLPAELRSKSFDFQRHIDFEADGDLMALVEGRQRLRERIAEARREINERRANGEVIPEAEMAAFHKAASEVGVMSENIAERSLQKYLDGEGFIQVYPEIGAPSSKSGDFDRIYIKEGDGRYQIFEVKGGSSKIKDRLINDVKGVTKGSVAEQGTLPYLKQILFEMGKKEATAQLSEDIALALKDGNVDYLHYRQGFTESGELATPQVSQFDIREPNTKKL